MAYAKGRRLYFPTQWHEIFLNSQSMSRISPHPIGWVINTHNSLHLTIWKIWICQGTLRTHSSTCIFPGTHDRCPERLSFCYCLPGQYNHFQQECRGIPRPHQAIYWKNYKILTYQWNSANATSLPKRSSTLDTSLAPQASDHYHQRLKPSRTCNHLKLPSRYMHF